MALFMIGTTMVAGISFLASNHMNFSDASLAIKSNRILSVRDSLAEQVRQLGELPAAYRASVFPELGDANSDLRDCLTSVAGCSLDQDTDHAVALHILSGSTLRKVTGTAAGPARYDLEGRICADQSRATAGCPFEVISSFRVFCSANPCTEPRFNMNYEVKISESLNAQDLKLPAVTRVSGISNPIMKTRIYPPTQDFEPVLIQSEFMLVTTTTTDGTVDVNRPTNPVLRALYDAGIQNETFYSAVLQAGLTDSDLARTIYEAMNWNRRSTTLERTVGIIDAWETHGDVIGTAIIRNRDLLTPEQIAAALAPVVDLDNKALAAGLITNNIRDPARITVFQTAMDDLSNVMIIDALISADITDAGYIDQFSLLVGGSNNLSRRLARSMAQARIQDENAVRLVTEIWIEDVNAIRIIDQANISRRSIAEAVLWSMPDATAVRAEEFNRIIVQSGTQDNDVIHRAASEGVTSTTEVSAIQEVINEERRLAELRYQEEYQAEQDLLARTALVIDTSAVDLISSVSSPTVTESTVNSSTTVVSTTTVTNGQSSPSGLQTITQTVSSDLLLTCRDVECPLITF